MDLPRNPETVKWKLFDDQGGRLIAFCIFLAMLLMGSCKSGQNSYRGDTTYIDTAGSDYIHFISGGCVMPCDRLEILIDGNGLMNFRRKEFAGPLTLYYGQLQKSENKEIWEIIHSVAWSDIEENYGLGSEDMTSKTLIIFTREVNKRILYKHGEPQSVTNIELLLRALIRNYEWKKRQL